MITTKEIERQRNKVIQDLDKKKFSILISQKQNEFLTNQYIYHDTDKSNKINAELQDLFNIASDEQIAYFNSIRDNNKGGQGFYPKENFTIYNLETFLKKYSQKALLFENANYLNIAILKATGLMMNLLNTYSELNIGLLEIKDKKTKTRIKNNFKKKLKETTVKEIKIISDYIFLIEDTKANNEKVYNLANELVLDEFIEVKKIYDETIKKGFS